MAQNDKCPSCGKVIPSDAPEGHCPACLLAAGLPTHEKARPAPPPGGTIRLSLPPLGEQPGDRIGRYKILQPLGEGGCGVVFMAEQTEPVKRRVALKVIKPGMDTREVLGRFEAERQALALMDHANIAKVFDAGATETGRPFFVMELVRGIPITRYCDENKLSTEQRLKLFIQVCQAIQHAHQKGIIHRDIKPSNILVADHDGVPVPKIIDFGIAKATAGQTLTDKTVFTALEQFIGTPAYMSPEQANLSGLDIDTRSDIYSLGVLLYELLTGKTPFDAKKLFQAGLDEIRRVIRQEEPQRPSQKISTLAAEEQTLTAKARQTDTPRLIQLVRGDLDWIVMKCLEKDRNRRYETANGLAVEIGRFINNEPIIARPPGQLYRFQKMVRRNKLAFAATSVVFAVLVLGVAGTTIGFIRSEKERRDALASQKVAQKNFETARAAVVDLLAVADEDMYDIPGILPLRVKLYRTTIDRYKPFLEQPLPDPAPRAELARLYVKYAFASYYNGADGPAVYRPAYQSAIAIQEQLLREHPNDRALKSDLAWSIQFSLWDTSINAEKSVRSHVDGQDKTSSATGLGQESSRDVASNLVEEQKALERGIKLFEDLVKEDPGDPFARADLAWALWLASIRTDHRSRELAERSLELREALVKQFPYSAEFRRDLANSLRQKARFLESEHGAALELLLRSIKLDEAFLTELNQNSPKVRLPLRPRESQALLLRISTYWTRNDIGIGCIEAARQNGYLGRWSEAYDLADKAATIFKQLVEQYPTISHFADQLGEANDLRQRAGDSGGLTAR